ncbi:MAG: transketolase family protein [Methanobacteriota archaeon]|nr:MAG: transketolase family protein [Euryarchaeota archaeon]
MTWKWESQRNQYGRALVELGKERGDVVVLDADLSSSTRTSDFAGAFPERFFNCGIAEQNMIDTAAGLASSGKTVFVSTFAVFGTGRCYDQIRQSVAYPKLNIKIVASHAGITVGGDGASHQIIEDLALMRVLPNMSVIVPVDSNETYKVVKTVAETKEPVYVRIGRADVPTVTERDAPYEMQKATVMREGDDVTLIGCGIMVSKCLEAADELAKHGIAARVINLHTIKPLDEKTIVKAARETGGVVTAEEHSVMMGMGSAVAMCLVENFHVPMKRVGIPDVFGESGACDELMERYGLTMENIVEAAHDVLKRKK